MTILPFAEKPLEIRNLIRQIATGWRAYRQKVRVDKNGSVYSLVVDQFPRALKAHLMTFDTIGIEGSTGAGNITAAPWIAVFDKRLTSSATNGFYVVYLFSIDLSTVTLSLALGTTQFQKQFGGPSKAFPRMRSAAARLQEMFNHLIPANLVREPIELSAKPRQKLHYSYQQATILSFAPYLIGELPEEAKLVADLQTLVHLYTDIVSDPLEVTVERLVEAVVEPASRVETIEMREFKPRQPKKNRAQGNSTAQRRRYSPESRKVGDAGERVVMQYERQRLSKIGRQDLADRVRWHGPELEFFGWDITSFDDDGNELFIEVKSSVGKTVTSVNLTANEWQAACDKARRERYRIYVVTNALSAKPKIERLKNPGSYLDDGQITCEPIVYELRLGPPTIEDRQGRLI